MVSSKLLKGTGWLTSDSFAVCIVIWKNTIQSLIQICCKQHSLIRFKLENSLQTAIWSWTLCCGKTNVKWPSLPQNYLNKRRCLTKIHHNFFYTWNKSDQTVQNGKHRWPCITKLCKALHISVSRQISSVLSFAMQWILCRMKGSDYLFRFYLESERKTFACDKTRRATEAYLESKCRRFFCVLELPWWIPNQLRSAFAPGWTGNFFKVVCCRRQYLKWGGIFRKSDMKVQTKCFGEETYSQHEIDEKLILLKSFCQKLWFLPSDWHWLTPKRRVIAIFCHQGRQNFWSVNNFWRFWVFLPINWDPILSKKRISCYAYSCAFVKLLPNRKSKPILELTSSCRCHFCADCPVWLFDDPNWPVIQEKTVFEWQGHGKGRPCLAHWDLAKQVARPSICRSRDRSVV